MTLDFIQPGKPTQNSYIERSNRSYRDELLDLYLFQTLGEVRQMVDKWMIRYDQERPHDSLNDMTPVEYLQAHNHPGNSNLAWDKIEEVYTLAPTSGIAARIRGRFDSLLATLTR